MALGLEFEGKAGLSSRHIGERDAVSLVLL